MLTITERKSLVEKYLPLANSLAWKKAKHTPKKVDIEELKSAAYMGLVDYVSRYDENEPFAPHARISGEMKDYLRSLAWGKRGEYVEAISTDFNEEFEDRFVLNPEEPYNFSLEVIQKITRGLDSIARDIIIMYSIEGKMLKQIAAKYNLSIGRVSQILKQAKEALSSEWTESEMLFEMAA